MPHDQTSDGELSRRLYPEIYLSKETHFEPPFLDSGRPGGTDRGSTGSLSMH